jgi:hypothetical protein
MFYLKFNSFRSSGNARLIKESSARFVDPRFFFKRIPERRSNEIRREPDVLRRLRLALGGEALDVPYGRLYKRVLIDRMTVAPRKRAILAGRKGPAEWLRNGQLQRVLRALYASWLPYGNSTPSW